MNNYYIYGLTMPYDNRCERERMVMKNDGDVMYNFMDCQLV